MTEVDKRISLLMRGAIDLHCHSGPSIMDRKLDHIEALLQADAVGMRAVMAKDHYYSVAPIAQLINKHFKTKTATLMSGVPLNYTSGGLNAHAVDHALRLGARLVWLPTFHAENHIRHDKQAAPGKEFPPRNISSFGAVPVPLFLDGEIRDELKVILDLIAKSDAVLSAGHIHISEIWVVFEEAKKRGVRRLLVNHPTYLVDATLGDLKALRDMGCYLEHSACMWVGEGDDTLYTPLQLKHMIEYGSLERTILGSDLGQAWNCTPVEGLRATIGILIDLAFSDEDIIKLVSTNARDLLGLS